MPIDFSPERWDRIKENSASWWNNTLQRPLMQYRHSGRDPGRAQPQHTIHAYTSFYEESVTADAIIDCFDYELSCTEFLGDAFPAIWPNFGPGVLAAFLGARLENSLSSNTIWFYPPREQEISDIHLEFDPNNRWVQRITDIYRAGLKRWKGQVQMGMTDLGGALDVLATFRPSEQLLFDLYDFPEEVQRVTNEIHEFWWQYFTYFENILKEGQNPGYTTWMPIFSEESSYLLQCDFCFMISPQMFDEFAKPELAKSCSKLKNSFYHLDGKGELPHLPSLLQIKDLKGVQWVNGTNTAPLNQWPEVFRAIVNAGKKTQFAGGVDILNAVIEQTGNPGAHVAIKGGSDLVEREKTLRWLQEWRIKK